jgi:hypothetical protein
MGRFNCTAPAYNRYGSEPKRPIRRPATLDAPDRFDAALAALSLDELEEAAGELHRRIGIALRALGEGRADRSVGTDLHARAPRWHVASLIAATELAAATFGALAAGGQPPSTRTDQHAATVAAIMYAAPTIPALLGRLEQDRRLLTSLARSFDTHLEERPTTAWGALPLRQLMATITVVEAARCAVTLEQAAASTDV